MKNLLDLTVLALATLLAAPLEAQDKSTPSDYLTVWPGMLPIIISAPHGGRQAIPGVAARRGIGVPQFTIERDNNTAELAELIAVKINNRFEARPFLIIAKFERKYIDANRSAEAAYESPAAKAYYDAYHREIETAADKIRQTWNGGLLLDIHGQAAEADTIFRGTDNGKAVTVLAQRLGRGAITGPKSIWASWRREDIRSNRAA